MNSIRYRETFVSLFLAPECHVVPVLFVLKIACIPAYCLFCQRQLGSIFAVAFSRSTLCSFDNSFDDVSFPYQAVFIS